jgi:hypothetical protein
MSVPYTFASASATLPLNELDANFATAITLGSTPVILGNTYTTISGLTLTNANITGIFNTNSFSIKENAGKLTFYYGLTAIASLNSSGQFTTLASVVSSGTP